MGIAGRPVQVRNPVASGVTRVDGPFLSAPLPVAGFALIEAADLDEAVDLAAKPPCAIAHGVVEVWPPRDKVPWLSTVPNFQDRPPKWHGAPAGVAAPQRGVALGPLVRRTVRESGCVEV